MLRKICIVFCNGRKSADIKCMCKWAVFKIERVKECKHNVNKREARKNSPVFFLLENIMMAFVWSRFFITWMLYCNKKRWKKTSLLSFFVNLRSFRCTSYSSFNQKELIHWSEHILTHIFRNRFAYLLFVLLILCRSIELDSVLCTGLFYWIYIITDFVTLTDPLFEFNKC